MADVDLSFLAKQSELVLQELRQLRREVADVRTLSLQTIDYVRRLDRRMGELSDDLQMMFKSELMGQLANFETRIELTQSRLEHRVEALEAR